MEYSNYGNLFQYLQLRPQISEDKLKSVSIQVCYSITDRY